MKIEKPKRSLKPSDMCLWLEANETYSPSILPAIVLESSGETLRLFIVSRTGGAFVKSGVLPFGHKRLVDSDGLTTPVGRENGSWFLSEDGKADRISYNDLLNTTTSLIEKIDKLSATAKKITELSRRVSAIEKTGE